MGRKSLIVILYTLFLVCPTESNREKLMFDTNVIGSKVYVGTNKFVTAHDGGLSPILKQIDTKVVIYLDKFDLIDVKNGHIHVMDESGKNSTINGTKITFLKLFVTDYQIVLSVASEAQYMMNRIVSSL